MDRPLCHHCYEPIVDIDDGGEHEGDWRERCYLHHDCVTTEFPVPAGV